MAQWAGELFVAPWAEEIFDRLLLCFHFSPGAGMKLFRVSAEGRGRWTALCGSASTCHGAFLWLVSHRRRWQLFVESRAPGIVGAANGALVVLPAGAGGRSWIYIRRVREAAILSHVRHRRDCCTSMRAYRQYRTSHVGRPWKPRRRTPMSSSQKTITARGALGR